MSAGKHTPGPWVVKFRNDHSCWISFGDAINGPHKQFDLPFDDLDPSDVADARLIAAAPEQHDVAVELDRLSLVIESAVRHADPTRHADVLALLRANRAAIAKATGSQA